MYFLGVSIRKFCHIVEVNQFSEVFLSESLEENFQSSGERAKRSNRFLVGLLYHKPAGLTESAENS